MGDVDEEIKREPDFAEGQIRSLLLDLSKDYSQQLRGIAKFKEYMAKYRPEVYDDDADLLFRGGRIDRGAVKGLLFWSGVLSTKHPGKFKRIVPEALNLLSYLVNLKYAKGEVNIFYSRFCCCSVDDLKKVNFDKHISSQAGGEDVRQCVELLGIARNEHRADDGTPDPIDTDEIITQPECRELFNQWLRSTGADTITQEVAQLKVERSKMKLIENRPRTWAEVIFRPLPVQEGEDGADTMNDYMGEVYMPVIDPLGLVNVDLKDAQTLREQKAAAEAVVSDPNALTNAIHFATERKNLETDETMNPSVMISSIVPNDKNFDVETFLSVIHGNTTVSQLEEGLIELEKALEEQSKQREALVRDHFGLFVKCAEGLEKLKDTLKDIPEDAAFRYGDDSTVGSNKSDEFRAIMIPGDDSSETATNLDVNGDEEEEYVASDGSQEIKLNDAELQLRISGKLLGKCEDLCVGILGPILEKMQLSRKIKSFDSNLRKLATSIEYPLLIQEAFEKEDYEKVIKLYEKVQTLPTKSISRLIQVVREQSTDYLEYIRASLLNSRFTWDKADTLKPLRLATFALAIDDVAGNSKDTVKKIFAKQLEAFSTLLTSIQKLYRSESARILQLEAKRPPTSSGHNKVTEVKIVALAADIDEKITDSITSKIDTILGLNDTDIYEFSEENLESKISKIRLSHIERLLEAMEANVPILYHLVGLLQHDGVIEIVKIPKRDTPIGSVRKSWPVKEQSVYLRNLVLAMQPCCEMLKFSLLGAPSSGGGDDVTRKGFFQRPLNDPYISKGLYYVSEIYDMIDSVLRGSSIADGSNSKTLSEIPEVVGREFSDIIKVVKDLLNDGEVATVDKKFQSLSMVGLRLFSVSPKDVELLHGEFSSVDVNDEFEIEELKYVNGRNYKHIVDIFEIYCKKTLTSVSMATKRPTWVAKSVRSNFYKSLSIFVDTLKVTICSDIAKASEPIKAFDEFSLDELEDFLQSQQSGFDTSSSSIAASITSNVPIVVLLSVVQACTILRNSSIHKLLDLAKSLFISEVWKSEEKLPGSGIVTETSDEQIETAIFTSNLRELQAQLLNELESKSYPFAHRAVVNTIIGLETYILLQYVQYVSRNIESIVEVGISTQAKDSLGLKTFSHHLSRAFLALEKEKSRFCRAVIFGEDETDNDADETGADLKLNYRKLVIYDLCISFVQVYDEKTDQLIAASGDDTTMATLAFRANEEFEFLKTSFSSIIPENYREDLTNFSIKKHVLLSSDSALIHGFRDIASETQLLLQALTNF